MRNSPTWTVDAIPDQSGRLAVVTGANSGIGYVTARELARRGARVVLACRDPERGQAALARMRDEIPGADLELRRVDLASLASVREFAAGWDLGPLDLLINNAGISMVPYSVTEDGFESQVAVNHLGPFALTGLLLPHLLAAPDPRVVALTSLAQRYARFDLDNLNAERGYSPMFTYAVAKRAVLYFALELQRRADAAGLRLRSMAAAPKLTRSNILTGGPHAAKGRLYRTLTPLVLRVAFRPTPEGAQTSLYAATVPDLPGGSYVVADGLLRMYGDPALSTRDPAIGDTDTARRLWEASEHLTGVSYESALPSA